MYISEIKEQIEHLEQSKEETAGNFTVKFPLSENFMLSVVKELKERREQQEKERAENLTQEFIEIAEEFITVSGKLFECLGFFAVVKFKQLKEKTCEVLDNTVDALIELGEQ